MNRHERRAAAARGGSSIMGATSDIGFEQYRDLYRRAYSKSSDREIGEGWMRGEAVVASGADYMMIHPAGETPSSPSDDDVFLSVNYGPQRFLARAAIRHLHMLINGWPSFVRQVREGIGKGMITDDARHDARGFIFDMVLDNRAQVDPTMAALTASAVAWLVTTSPVGGGLRQRA
jgi:hypothetical protein